MAAGNVYKPRYTIAYLAKNKIWPYKNSRLRRFFSLRGRRLHRGGLFRRYVLVFTTRKWTEIRRQFRPQTRRTGYSRAGGATTAFGRPRSRRYRDSFYIKQQVRSYLGKIRESTLRSFVQNSRSGSSFISGQSSRSFTANLGTRLDHVLFRRRFIPTVYACHQFIRHRGLSVNGGITYAPQSRLTVGDRLSIIPVNIPQKSTVSAIRLQRWRVIIWDLFVRFYYRRWGLYILRRRNISQLRKKVRLFAFSGGSFNFPYSEASIRSVEKSKSYSLSPLSALNLSGSFNKGSFFLRKLRSYLKFRLSRRLRSSFLPRIAPLNHHKSYYNRASRRQSLIRFNFARRSKIERRRKFIRLQPVHFRRPSYLQRDFRTLQAILIHLPSSEEISFPFRGSFKQVESFYHSRGILFIFLIRFGWLVQQLINFLKIS